MQKLYAKCLPLAILVAVFTTPLLIDLFRKNKRA
jgi:hypothetical protein